MRAYFGQRFAAGDREQLVRRKLVGSLYAQPTSLAMGALAGIVTAGAAALETGDPFIKWCAALLIAVAVTRVVAAAYLLHETEDEKADPGFLGLLYQSGALTYALLVGAVGAGVLSTDASTHLQTLAVSYALVYGVGIAARNAAHPGMAIGQQLLTALPILWVALSIGDLAMYVLAGIIVTLFLGMASVTLNVFKVLREQILAADAAEKLAAKMREQARTDVVTGLLNRAGLNQDLVELLMTLPAG